MWIHIITDGVKTGLGHAICENGVKHATSDVLTKNLSEKDHLRHSATLRNGKLGSWREDVR